MDLIQLSKGYFRKSDESRLETKIEVFTKLLLTMYHNELEVEQLLNHLDRGIQQSLEHEDYEITEILTQVKEMILATF